MELNLDIAMPSVVDGGMGDGVVASEAEDLVALRAVDPVTAEAIASHVPTGDVVWTMTDHQQMYTQSMQALLTRLQSAESSEPLPDVLVVVGAPEPHDLQALLERKPEKVRVLLVERSAELFAKLFKLCPIAQYIGENRLRVAVGDDPGYAEKVLLSLLDMPKGPKLELIGLEYQTPENQAYYHEMLMQVRGGIRKKVYNLGTLMQHGQMWQQNTLTNIKDLLSCPGVNTLNHLFDGRPALVVGAGPSLNEIKDYLKALHDRFVVIATGTALRPLRAMGIRPDLVIAVDGDPKVARQFETQTDDCFLVCSAVVCPGLFDKMKGVFCGYLEANAAARWFSRHGAAKGSVLGAGTVTAAAMQLAVGMGCDPVVTVGFDLAVAPDGTSHAANSMYDGVKQKENRLVSVKGNVEASVMTTQQFAVYRELVGDYIETRPGVDFVNVNPGGAEIPGMRYEKPERLGQYASSEAIGAYARFEAVQAAYELPDQDEIMDSLEAVIEELEQLERETVSAAMQCNRLIMHLRSRRGRTDGVDAVLESLSRVDQRITESRSSSELIDMSLRAIYYSAGGGASLDDLSVEQRAIEVNRRSRYLYEQIAGAARGTRLALRAVGDSLSGEGEAGVRTEEAEPEEVRCYVEAG